MINLPEEYEKEMRGLLGAEFEEYKKTYEQPVRQGLRFNPYKKTDIMFMQRKRKKIPQDILIILQVFITFRSPVP